MGRRACGVNGDAAETQSRLALPCGGAGGRQPHRRQTPDGWARPWPCAKRRAARAGVGGCGGMGGGGGQQAGAASGRASLQHRSLALNGRGRVGVRTTVGAIGARAGGGAPRCRWCDGVAQRAGVAGREEKGGSARCARDAAEDSSGAGRSLNGRGRARGGHGKQVLHGGVEQAQAHTHTSLFSFSVREQMRRQWGAQGGCRNRWRAEGVCVAGGRTGERRSRTGGRTAGAVRAANPTRRLGGPLLLPRGPLIASPASSVANRRGGPQWGPPHAGLARAIHAHTAPPPPNLAAAQAKELLTY